MAEDHRRLAEEVAQGILFDDPGFLKEIVESVLQELLEVEMTEHVGPLPTNVVRGAPGIATATSRGLCACPVPPLPRRRDLRPKGVLRISIRSLAARHDSLPDPFPWVLEPVSRSNSDEFRMNFDGQLQI